jgi:hypothetical protein
VTVATDHLRSLTVRHETYELLGDSVKDIYSSLTFYPLSSLVLDSQLYSLSSPWAVAQLDVTNMCAMLLGALDAWELRLRSGYLQENTARRRPQVYDYSSHC